jgi:hypothetical protein
MTPVHCRDLANDPEFINVGFHIGNFITTVVDTEANCANIESLYTDLDSTSTRINVSIFYLVFYYLPYSTLTPLLLCRN